jgi:fatty-acyl-CoA synthase
MRIGGILVPLNYRLAAAELSAIVAHAGASQVIADDAFAPVAAALGPALQSRETLTRSLDAASADAA